MLSESKITEIYCIVDKFCKYFALQQEKCMVEDKNKNISIKKVLLEICNDINFVDFILILGCCALWNRHKTVVMI